MNRVMNEKHSLHAFITILPCLFFCLIKRLVN